MRLLTLIIEKASTIPMQTLFENHMFPQNFASGLLLLPGLPSQLPQSAAEALEPQPPALALKPARGAAVGPHPISLRLVFDECRLCTLSTPD